MVKMTHHWFIFNSRLTYKKQTNKQTKQNKTKVKNKQNKNKTISTDQYGGYFLQVIKTMLGVEQALCDSGERKMKESSGAMVLEDIPFYTKIKVKLLNR